LPLRRRTRPLDRGLLVEHAADIVSSVDSNELMRDVEDRPAAVAGIELVHLAGELVVDGVELLVDGHQLLVAGLQLLERRFVFLDGRLQAVARFAQLVLEAGGVAVRWAWLRLRDLLARQRPPQVRKDDQVQPLLVALDERLDGDSHELYALVQLHLDALADDGMTLGDRLAQHRAQLQPQLAARHRLDLPARRSHLRLQVFVG
jgi:hypothetical protein